MGDGLALRVYPEGYRRRQGSASPELYHMIVGQYSLDAADWAVGCILVLLAGLWAAS